jgi:NAD(P)H-quinone oxidoreductase subunit 5
MNQNLLALIALLSPLIFIATALASWFQPGMRPLSVKRMALVSTVSSIAIAAISGFFVIKYGLLETSLLGINNIGLSLRLDALSILMLSMIALLGFIVVRFSFNYLDGDERQGAFTGRLAATIASVQLLVLSGNLGLLFISWVLTSVSLHRLLVFYKERPGAIIAARKKFIVARLGDVSLLAAIVLLYFQFGTGNLESIFQSIQNSMALGLPINGIETVAILLALAALLKSAQFPTHGWLIEVMETPTPVSALLHAGLLNAGPFLIIRMAYIMEASTYAPLILITLGGFTALFASVVFLTQTSIKNALGYSSVAHMGFSLMVCGLGVYPAAMLHLVAHSFYKAHSFLSSGSIIDVIRSAKVTAAKRMGSPIRIALGIILGFAVYSGFAIVWGVDPVNEFSLLAIGAIIVMGLSRLFTSAIDSNGSLKLMLQASLLSLIVTTAFFILESGTHYLLSSQLPELLRPSVIEMVLIAGILITFGITVFIQIAAPALSSSPFYQEMAIHLRNGLYVNTVFDRTVRALYSHGTHNKAVSIENIELIKEVDSIKIERYEQQAV